RHMEESVGALAAQLVDELVSKGEFDGVSDLAHALPLKVVPDLVGWPEQRRGQLVEWASATFNVLGPLNDRAKQSVSTAQAMLAYADEVATTGDLLPGSVGAGVIEAARRGDLEQERVAPLLVGYLAPSLDTTISALGSMAWLLATHTDQWRTLKQDPDLAGNAFEEVVRLESPIRVFSRVTSRPVEVDGIEIPEGARIMLLYPSANRDERQFERPDEFDVRRPNAREHVGFGYGVHGCAGQGMARMEGRALLRALLDRVDRIELIGAPVPLFNNLIHGFAKLPMRVARGSA
ncbi:MAG: cytochrome P450, partial [Actinomycetota bacterium]|nr:cytochrome P450 [Actinomycetota bacterium]